MVQNFAKEGRIKNDAETIQKWVNKAKEDFDGVKALIEELPLNKKSEKLDGDDNKKPAHTTWQRRCLKSIQNKLKNTIKWQTDS